MTTRVMRAETAIILAAGVGVRLAPTGHDTPKGFIQLGSIPIVEESVLRLIDAGVADVLIVTGYQAGYYEDLASRHPNAITLVHNDRYRDLGSMESLAVASRQVAGDVLVVESDLIYERRALEVVLDHPGSDVTLVSGFTASGDECFVEASGDVALVGISKDRARLGPRVVGEMVGITRLSRPGLDAVVDQGRRMAEPGRAVAYEDVLAATARTIPIHCAIVDDLVWSEIDDALQLDRARRLVYPRLMALDEARRTAATA